jgi:hypothetical protein
MTVDYTLVNETVCLGGGDQFDFSWTWGFSWDGICLTDTPVRVVNEVTWTNSTIVPD